MFQFNELKQLHLEITNNCQASCPMCSRNIHGGIDNPLIKIQNWTLADFKTIVSNEVLSQIEGLYFCGNYGDPILNNDLLAMCEYVTTASPKQNLRIHTNGSARNTEWWARLASVLPPTHNVVFAIDGLQDTHEIYRIGTSYDTIIKNATAFIKAGGTAEWCFIKFKHNEHQVEEAQKIANELGFKHFTVKNSSRFIVEPRHSVKNKEGEILYYIEPPKSNKMVFIDKTVIDSYKNVVDQSVINCYAEKVKEIYIDAYRNVFPCCWIALIPYNYIEPDDYAGNVRLEVLSQYHELVKSLGGIDKLNAVNNSIKSIIDSHEYQTVWNHYWDNKKLITCARTCGVMKENNISKPSDQFIETLTINE
jgi:MoaA/NifB/PqqE/SkfB family radical SAM enzyme